MRKTRSPPRPTVRREGSAQAVKAPLTVTIALSKSTNPGEHIMRAILAILIVAAALAAPARAEKRTFVIANNPDGYGIDRCLSTGASCGTAVAAAYCHTHAFSRAVSFRKVDRGDITDAVPTAGGTICRGAGCDAFVAIECTR